MSRFIVFINLSCVSIGAFLLIVLTSACVENPPESFQGYVEGEFVYVAAPIGGRLEELNVRRGQSVTEGTILFKLEQDFEEAVVQEASNKLTQAMDKLSNIKKGKRPSEIQAIEARLKNAKAGLKLAEIGYTRRIELSKKEFISEENLDRARTIYDQRLQEVTEIAAEIETARLGARPDEIKAAEAEVKAAKADLVQATYQYLQAYADLEHSVGVGKGLDRPPIGHKGFSVDAIAKVSR
ncbi:MAG: biotin/lipoyl-binding protein [Pseudomonadota bacterium]